MSVDVLCLEKSRRRIEATPEAVQYDSMEDMVKDYVELKTLINRLEQAKKTLNEQMEKGLSAFGIDAFQLKIDEVNYQMRRVTRPYHSCNWDGLKNMYPEVYDEFVVDAESTFVEVRQVKDAAEKARTKKKKTTTTKSRRKTEE